MPKTSNRLAAEKSPYLLQHAYNPVDWYPWGEEAFAAAKQEDKPIFLSIGYSTCHWCHVMERESFQDQTVAAALNDAFICVKVDREERPDVDTVYMNVCQALTGSGGWPLTVIMTPGKEPFYAGTYFPPQSRYGRPGVIEIAENIKKSWHENKEDLIGRAGQIVAQMRSIAAEASSAIELDKGILDQGFRYFKHAFDEVHGGFSQAPKFPSPHNLLFLLRYWRRTGDEVALSMVETTLRQMRRGGVYDHLGGGFHRYATDHKWLVPHFEKMLYDQAMLAIAYTEAWQATKHADFADTARDIIDYVLRNMQAAEGAFFAAEDADSEGEEGKFYVWTLAEIEAALPVADARLAISIFNVSEQGNYLGETTGKKTGTNILHLSKSLAELAQEHNLTESELADRLKQIRQKLLAVRQPRVHPFKDTKILTDWNGLMVAALALAGRAFNDDHYLAAAADGVAFLRSHLRQENGKLYKRWREGEAALPAQLDDYAFLIWGLLELYTASQEVSHLAWAIELQDIMIATYWDPEQGGFFLTANDAEEFFLRPKEIYDGAIPSGNSVAIMNCLRLSRLTGRMELEEYAAKAWATFSQQIATSPAAHRFALAALDFSLGPTHEVVIAGEKNAPDTKALLRALHEEFLPNTVLLFYPQQKLARIAIAILAPFISSLTTVDGQATAYVCSNFSCQQPVHSVTDLLASLR